MAALRSASGHVVFINSGIWNSVDILGAMAIIDDIENHVRAIRARLELAAGDLLTDGKFSLVDENGLTLEADFQVPTAFLPTAATLWTDTANSTPLDRAAECSALIRACPPPSTQCDRALRSSRAAIRSKATRPEHSSTRQRDGSLSIRPGARRSVQPRTFPPRRRRA